MFICLKNLFCRRFSPLPWGSKHPMAPTQLPRDLESPHELWCGSTTEGDGCGQGWDGPCSRPAVPTPSPVPAVDPIRVSRGGGSFRAEWRDRRPWMSMPPTCLPPCCPIPAHVHPPEGPHLFWNRPNDPHPPLRRRVCSDGFVVRPPPSDQLSPFAVVRGFGPTEVFMCFPL